MKQELAKILMHFPDEEITIKQYYDWCEQALNGKIILTKFLNPRQQEILRMVTNHFQLFLQMDGGYDEAIIKRGLISDTNLINQDMDITQLEVIGNQKFRKLTHRDVLGAIMSLQVSRELIGDFCFGERIFIIVDSKIVSLIVDNLKKIANVSVHFEISNDPILKKQEFTEKKIFAKSLRIDALISQLFKLSRKEAKDKVDAKDVKVNYKIVTNPSLVINNDSEISLRGHGKVKVKIIEIKKAKKEENKQKKIKSKFVIEVNYYK